jgi:hypothetical protein
MKGTTFFVFLILAVCHFFHPTKMEAAYSSVFYPADSIVQSLMLRRDGEIIKSISVGQQVSIKPFNAARVSGKLSEISSEFLVVDQTKIPIDIIDWIKVRKKSKNPAASFLKGIGIAAGIGLLAVASFVIVFSISYSGAGGGAVLLGGLIIGGLILLFVSLLSGKKYKLRKYDIELREG